VSVSLIWTVFLSLSFHFPSLYLYVPLSLIPFHALYTFSPSISIYFLYSHSLRSHFLSLLCTTPLFRSHFDVHPLSHSPLLSSCDISGISLSHSSLHPLSQIPHSVFTVCLCFSPTQISIICCTRSRSFTSILQTHSKFFLFLLSIHISASFSLSLFACLSVCLSLSPSLSNSLIHSPFIYFHLSRSLFFFLISISLCIPFPHKHILILPHLSISFCPFLTLLSTLSIPI
jgi:hypothetical protein